jgi:hypothetical protein
MARNSSSVACHGHVTGCMIFFAMFKFEFRPHVTLWHAKGACHLICIPLKGLQSPRPIEKSGTSMMSVWNIYIVAQSGIQSTWVRDSNIQVRASGVWSCQIQAVHKQRQIIDPEHTRSGTSQERRERERRQPQNPSRVSFSSPAAPSSAPGFLQVWRITASRQCGVSVLFKVVFRCSFRILRRRLHLKVRIRFSSPYSRFGGASSTGGGRVESCAQLICCDSVSFRVRSSSFMSVSPDQRLSSFAMVAVLVHLSSGALARQLSVYLLQQASVMEMRGRWRTLTRASVCSRY